MTTTLQAHGGGAQPASIDTSGKVAGGAAQRVYGFDSVEAAQAAGYVCEGGPAMSVALITDAQIASGAWKAEGDPSALVVYTAPDGMPVEGGYAVPVYSVNGWSSSTPAPDAIGDGLRADCKAYWKLDEASGTRIDATGRGHNATLSANPPTSATGKVNNAAGFNGSDQALYVPSHADLQMTGDFSICCWFKWDSLADLATSRVIIGKIAGSFGDYMIYYSYVSPEDTSIVLEVADGNDSNGVNYPTPQVVNTWYFVVAWFNTQAGTISIQVNNGTPSNRVENLTLLPTSDQFYFADGDGWGYDWFHGLIDECGIWKRLLTSDERDYLYNSGAGRTLYP